MTTRSPGKLTEMPDIPKEFGEDGGHFYQHYDKLAEESDEELVKNLKAQLDGILIFAGLFAGVNSTFLVFTLPQLSPDPADDTNALLLQIALGGNSSITSTADLPSSSFLPSHRIYLVNVLFSVSLMLALFSSILAVFGQQWIVCYRKRGGGGAEDRRWDELRRYLGAKRWRLELLLDDLVPSMLQIGLVIFCIAFALYLGTLSQPLNRIIAWLLYVAAAAVLTMATCAAFDPWCPFKPPLSRISRCVASAVLTFAVCCFYSSYWLLIYITTHVINAIWSLTPYGRSPNGAKKQLIVQSWALVHLKRVPADIATCYRWLMLEGIQFTKDPGDLKVEALRRMICRSEDHDALIYAAMNLQVLRDERVLSPLAKDREFCLRLTKLHEAAMGKIQHGPSSSRYSLVVSKALSTSYFHFIITTSSDPQITRIKHQTVIRISSALYTDVEEMSHLLQGSLLALNTSCDQCSHCATLLFSIRLAHITLESAENRSVPDLQAAFNRVLGTSARTDDLKLGFMMASLMIFRTQRKDEEWDDPNNRLRNKFLRTLFAAYREKDEQIMFRKISIALTTVGDEWRGWPDHEIFVWLFELCLLPGTREIYDVDQHLVLTHVDNHLLSLEKGIRDEGASEIERQRGRDYQNRYVQSIAGFCAAQNYSPQKTWNLINTPLERYLKSIKQLMESQSGHPENSETMDLLLGMESAFTGPQPVGASASRTNHEQTTASSNFRQLINEIGLNVPRKALVSIEEKTAQAATGRADDGRRVGLPENVYDMWGY